MSATVQYFCKKDVMLRTSVLVLLELAEPDGESMLLWS